MKKRHKWGYTPKRKTVDMSVQGCSNCSCTREYIAGKVAYFLNDTYYQQAPVCDPNNVYREPELKFR